MMEEEKLKEKHDKERKRSLFLMTALIIVFVIGILSRWNYVKKEITETIDHYFKKEQFQHDTINPSTYDHIQAIPGDSTGVDARN